MTNEDSFCRILRKEYIKTKGILIINEVKKLRTKSHLNVNLEGC